MATKSRTTGARGGARGGTVSLADEDRQYINESLSRARGRVGTAAAVDEGSLFEALERFGLSSDRVERLRTAIDDLDVRESIDRASEYLAEQIENARDFTRENPRKVIGGAAGVLVGASLLALAIRRATGEEKRTRSASSSSSSSSSKKSSGSKKTSSRKRSAARKGGAKSSSSKSAKSSGSKSRAAKRR